MQAQHTLSTVWTRFVAVAVTLGLALLAIFLLFGALVLGVALAASAALLAVFRGRRIAPPNFRWRFAPGSRAAGRPETGRRDSGEVVDVVVREIDSTSSR
ncbi:MAG: hypothetical protein ABIR94_18660 [Rubrivivax sp.]